jgi:hypothetical protein
MRFRHDALSWPVDVYDRARRGYYDDVSPSRLMQRCLNDPVWHRVEELMR